MYHPVIDAPTEWEWGDLFSLRPDRTSPGHLCLVVRRVRLSPDDARALAGSLLKAAEAIEGRGRHAV